MKYLLDTDVIVDHLRNRKGIDVVWLDKGSAISIITKAELLYGAHKSDQLEKNLDMIEQMFKELPIEFVTLSDDILDIFARTKVYLETKGKRLDDFDLLIAATAISEELILVTRNIKHYQRIPRLKLLS